ncbi:sugar-binding protein [Paenibacillus sp. EZ-K15]|uniref:sugar-binding protein n=1 Tax=Paenibacillus sp. EZ-K15 TaxID=2044275 RepID=UPI001379F0F1|nr:sugar-binding protein [Paenibacillus sp. EZ-K15]
MFSYKTVSSVVVLALLMNLFMLGEGSAAKADGAVEPPAVTDFVYTISDFEMADDQWDYTFGEQPNIQGSFEVIELEDAYTGQHAGKLNADFRQSSKDKAAYTAMRKEFEGLELEQYAFWVRTSELTAVRIRTTDATGQTFQQKINLQDTADWQQVVVNSVTSGQYWGGAANGKWNAPAKKIAIMIDRNDIKDGKLTASMLVDKMTAKLNLPDLKIKQSVLGNIYLDNGPVTFTVATRFPEVAWQVYDLNGQLVREGIVLTPNGGGQINLPDLELGYYSLDLSALSGSEGPVRLKTTFALLSDYDWDAVGDSPFGIAAHLHRESFGWSGELARLIKYAGARTARGGYEWSIEKSPGQYTFTPQPERFMSHVQAEGLKSMFVSGYNNPFYDNNATPYTDAGREGFANYVNAYINQYKDHLVGVQVYNEFNGGFGKRGNSPADSKPEYYYELLKKTYETVKANHPDFTVSGMVTAGIDLEWIEEVLKLGGIDYLDNIAVHPYRYGRAVVKDRAPEGMAAELEQLKLLIREYNGGELKPIWISEFGWPTHQAAIGVDEKTQADFLARAYVIALSQGVERIVWYNLMNDGLQADYNEHNFGLIRFKDDPLGAHTPKPAYVAYAAMARELTNAAFVEEETYGGDIKSYLFDQDGKALRAVWAVEDTNVAVLTNEPLLITDITGHSEQFVPHNGKIYLTLNGEILYIKGNLSGIVEDHTFSITGEETFIGDEAGFTVQLFNQDSVGEFKVDLEAEGVSQPIAASHGSKSQERITLLPARDASFRSVVVSIKDGEQTIGRLRHSITVLEANEVKVRPTLTLEEDGSLDRSLDLEIENFSKTKNLSVNGAVWSAGDQSGQQQWNEQVKPGEKRRFIIPLEAAPMGTDLQTAVKVEFGSGLPFEFAGNISFNPILQGNGTAVDTETESGQAEVPPTIDLSNGKKVLLSGHSGSIDLTGHISLQHDKDNLYLLAEVEDDVHAAPEGQANIWNNDSIQFAIAPGIPGESQGFYEFGIADTPDGAQVYRWSNLEGKIAEAVQRAKAEVIRDEEQKLTTYRLALPWSELTPIKPDRGEVISFSLLVNDNDGNGRRGWVEWASGIGNEKRPSLFRSMQWIFDKQQTPPIAADASFMVTAGKRKKGNLQAEYPEGAKLQFEIVDRSKKGVVKLIDAAAGRFEYAAAADAAGEDHFTFRVRDGSQVSNIATVSIVIESKQKPNPKPKPKPKSLAD